MNTILTILSRFSTTEKKAFSNYLVQRNRRNDPKNIEMLRLIEAGKETEVKKRLYPDGSNGAFHALCKRFYDCLVDFVATQNFADESSEDMETLKLLLASRLFFEQKLYKVGIKTLNKAEKKAQDLENRSILNEVYHTKIQHAHLNPKWVRAEIIAAYQKNKVVLEQDFQLNIAYSQIKHSLAQTPEKDIEDIITEAFLHSNIKISEDLTYKSLYQLMEITATTGTLQRDFYSIAPYMNELFKVVEEKGPVPRQQQFYYYHILYLLAVTDFRNKQFETSKKRLSQIEKELEDSGRNSYTDLKAKLKVLYALNAVYVGDANKAIMTLETKENTSLNKQLLLTMCYFQQGSFSKANAVLLGMNKSDLWYQKKMGWIWVLKKNILAILLYIELDKLDIVLNGLDRFSKIFGPKLRAIGEQRVLVFMDFVREYYERPALVITEDFKNRVGRSFEWKGSTEEDIFVMSFYAWLKAKMEEKDLYEVTLELVA